MPGMPGYVSEWSNRVANYRKLTHHGKIKTILHGYHHLHLVESGREEAVHGAKLALASAFGVLLLVAVLIALVLGFVTFAALGYVASFLGKDEGSRGRLGLLNTVMRSLLLEYVRKRESRNNPLLNKPTSSAGLSSWASWSCMPSARSWPSIAFSAAGSAEPWGCSSTWVGASSTEGFCCSRLIEGVADTGLGSTGVAGAASLGRLDSRFFSSVRRNTRIVVRRGLYGLQSSVESGECSQTGHEEGKVE